MTLELRINRLRIQAFRNIGDLTLTLAPRVNVISGDNGQGKTSVLEALYFLATSRSFRADRLREICQDDSPGPTLVEGMFTEGELGRKQRAVLHQGTRTLSIDDKKPPRLSSYATRTPVVIFHPGDLELVSGSAVKRRTLLDRVALFLDPESGDHRQRYARAQKERQRGLELGKLREVEVFETLMAQHGAALTAARRRASDALERALKPAFGAMAPGALVLELSYQPGGTEVIEDFVRELRTRRDRDRRTKSATFGPGKDDVVLTLDGRPARRHASQGQQRILTLALKVAELECVKAARGAQPILLLDDVSSELDPTRTGAVYDFVRTSQSQVLVTTTRPELFETPGLGDSDRADFRVHAGALVSGA